MDIPLKGLPWFISTPALVLVVFQFQFRLCVCVLMHRNNESYTLCFSWTQQQHLMNPAQSNHRTLSHPSFVPEKHHLIVSLFLIF